MSRSARPINQHWVPQFYLRYFATPETREVRDGQRAWLYDKKNGKHSTAPTSVKKFLAERYLYSPETPEGERDWIAEELLGEAETAAAELWPKVIAHQVSFDDPEIRYPLARFVGFLQIRNVRLRNIIDSTMKLRDKLFGPVTGEAPASREPNMPDPNHPGRFFSHTVINGDDRLTKGFSALKWTALTTREDVFITGDNPVQFVQGALGKPNSAAIFPFSPRVLLVMQNITETTAGDCVEFGIDQARKHNKQIFAGCERFMVTGRPIGTVLQELDVIRPSDRPQSH